MARSLSLFTKSLSTKTPPFSLSTLRFQSVLSSPNPNSDDDATPDAHIRLLEDAIHHLVVRRSAPDWLPFLPGSSYWVPPPSRSASVGLAHLVDKLVNPMTDEESLASNSVRGWPSANYYIGQSPLTKVKSSLTGVKVALPNMEEESPSSSPSKLEAKLEDKED